MSRLSKLMLLLLLAPSLALGACAEEDNDTAQAAPDDEAGVTYAQDIAPLIEANCGECHREGGAAPFVLDSFEALEPLATASLASIEAGTMPPWQPDPDCRTFEDERIMPAADVALFKEWIDGGMAPGDLSAIQTIESPQEVTFEPTHTAAIADPYQPSDANPDDYRCFVLDLDFDKEMYMKASTVLPDAGALVHHVLVYSIGPDQLDTVLEADENEPGEGYTCFGAPFPGGEGDGGIGSALSGGGLPTQVGTWVPGSEPQVLDDGLGIRIEAGSKIVMQIHYNMLGSTPAPDQTAFVMQLTEEQPDFLIDTKPLIIRSLDIPGGEPEAINTRVYTNHSNKTIQIGSVAAHMHLLGSRYKTQIVRSNGDTECLLEIPKWDFNWQQNYRMPEAVTLAPGDSISLECVYDNSPGNQPVVNGEQIEPRDVSWGEGTLDEMCMLYMSIITPFEPAEQGEQCAGVSECVEACQSDEGGATSCLLQCADDLSCQICGLQSLTTCGRTCLPQLAALQSAGCLETCFMGAFGFGSNLDTCMASACGDAYSDLQTCLDPVLDGGSCDEALTGCGL